MNTPHAARLREAMQLRGMKQTDLVRITNINKGTLSSYLAGRFVPKQRNLFLLAQALNVNEAWLTGTDNLRERLPLNNEFPPSSTESISNGTMTINSEEFFQLQVQESSMEPRICPGDLVIVHKQDDANSGDIVIASIQNQQNVCKRLRKYHDGIELISNNPSIAPVFYSTKEIQEQRIKILGKVVELWAKL